MTALVSLSKAVESGNYYRVSFNREGNGSQLSIPNQRSVFSAYSFSPSRNLIPLQGGAALFAYKNNDISFLKVKRNME